MIIKQVWLMPFAVCCRKQCRTNLCGVLVVHSDANTNWVVRPENGQLHAHMLATGGFSRYIVGLLGVDIYNRET